MHYLTKINHSLEVLCVIKILVEEYEIPTTQIALIPNLAKRKEINCEV